MDDATPRANTTRGLPSRAADPTREDYKSIVEALHEGIWIIDAQSDTTFVNEPMATMLGYTPEEMIGSPLFSYMDRRGTQIANDNLQRRLAGISEQHDFEFLHRDGSRVYTAMATAPITDEDGNYGGAVAGVLDITQRRQAEDALRSSEVRFRAVFEEASVAIVLAKPDGRIIQVNPAMERMLGYPAEQLTQMTAGQVTFPEDRAATASVFRGVLSGGGGFHMEKRYVRSDGEIVHAVTSVAVIPDADGKPLNLLAMLQDVTELKRAQEELVRVQRLESLGVLAGGIAHDYNNILTSVLANVALALEDAVPGSEQAEFLRAAEDASHQAMKLARQLLTFSRGGAPMLAPVDLAALVRETTRFCLAGSSLRCELTLAEDLSCVVADSGQIGQVLTNLVTNAIQAQPKGGILAISAKNTELAANEGSPDAAGSQYVELTVRDEGTGISAEALAHVFDPYFTTKPAGTGLGLAVTHRILQNHNGTIDVESVEGAGTSFTIRLPAHQGEIPGCRSKERRVSTLSAHVLVMDDEPVIRRVASVVLRRRGCRVAEAKHGQEALDRYAKAAADGDPFDVVILDLTIPGAMGGQEALTRLREMDPAVRALVSSGYSSDSTMAEYEQQGFSGVLAKPYGPAELAAAVEKVLGDSTP